MSVTVYRIQPDEEVFHISCLSTVCLPLQIEYISTFLTSNIILPGTNTPNYHSTKNNIRRSN